MIKFYKMETNKNIAPEEKTDKKGNEPTIENISKKAAEETDKERGFKEGLANNSDTEKK